MLRLIGFALGAGWGIFASLKSNDMPDIDLIINDEAVTNDRGWRLVNSGMDRNRYDKNPLLLYQHDTERIIGRCTGLRTEGSQLIGSFEFDIEDEAAQDVAGKAERGFIRGASPGIYVKRLDFGDSYDRVTEWELLEVSLVTIPSNPCAVRLYAADGKPLSDEEAARKYTILKAQFDKPIMKEEEKQSVQLTALTPEALQALELEEGATPEAVSQAVSRLSADRTRLAAELERIAKERGEKLVANAIANGKIAESAKEDFIAFYSSNPDLCERCLSALPTKRGLSAQIVPDKPAPSRFDASWDELDRAGLLSALREENPELYAEKYNARFHKNH